MRILIANRGEIARRIIRSAHRMGHQTVAVFAEPDAGAPFTVEASSAVLIGPADLNQSYLSVERLLEAAETSGATAVHPGYGFLSENGDFAGAVVDAGLIWIGPSPEIVESMGSKIEARRIAANAGVAIIPGFDRSQDQAELAEAADRIGFPVLVKAAAGGGGKGIRIVNGADEFEAALNEARSEAMRSFGDDRMIVERFIERPRHVEVQVMGDRHGNVVELGTRECSVQRRYQKLWEEAPAPNLSAETAAGVRQSAVTLAEAIGYDSAGTVEFVVDDDNGEFFFLEVNTRLQVEHTVTEMVTGLDLVELQIRVAAGEELPDSLAEVTLTGHAIEARINAEDPGAGFAPQTGDIVHLVVPDDVRFDSAVVEGSTVSPYYDSMIAKLIVSAPDRAGALERMRHALDGLIVGGLVTNTGFHRWLVDQDAITEARITTRFLDETDLDIVSNAESAAAVAAGVWHSHCAAQKPPDAWSRLPDFSLTPFVANRPVFLEHHSGEPFEASPGADRSTAASVRGNSVAVNVGGTTHTFRVLTRSEHWSPADFAGHGHAGSVLSPFPAVVAEVLVEVGQTVAGGDALVVIEAMKMLHSLKAAGPGVVAEVRVEPGDQTVANQVLIIFEDQT